MASRGADAEMFQFFLELITAEQQSAGLAGQDPAILALPERLSKIPMTAACCACQTLGTTPLMTPCLMFCAKRER